MLFHPLWGFPIMLVGSLIIHIGLKEKIFGIFIPNYTATFGCLVVVVGMVPLLEGSMVHPIIAIAVGLCISLNPIINTPDTIRLTAFMVFAAGLCNLSLSNNRYRPHIRPHTHLSQTKSHHSACRTTGCRSRSTCHH